MKTQAPRGHVLLVEDDASLREVLTFNLEDGDYEVSGVASAEAALQVYDPDEHDVVITDLRLPAMNGMDLLRALRARAPRAVVLMMTAFGTLETAVSAMQEGAFHYVEKPVNNRTLLALLARAVEFSRLGRENLRLVRLAREQASEKILVATSPGMNQVLRLVDKVADSDATVLITGESGTGKELVARALHARSSRAQAAFVTVNCAAIPEQLLESVLFGHERGAFTGAAQAAKGKFATADGGTLFLDEIGEMSPDLQAKVLRVLQDGEIDPVGASRAQHVDVRVVAATHRNLETEVAQGRFRSDLFYRVNVVPIVIPPLRERREDIPVLFRHFLRKHGGAAMRVDRQVDVALLQHPWPGNVRELENLAERLVLLAEGGELTLDDLPATICAGVEPLRARTAAGSAPELPFALPDEGLDLVALERDIIAAVLHRTGGNQSAAARYLRIPRHVLLYRLEKFGLKDFLGQSGAGQAKDAGDDE